MKGASSLNTFNIPLVAGSALPGRAYKLAAQRIAIRGVVVDNANSTTDVYVYAGEGANGIPTIVKAGWSRGFPLEGPSQIYCTFPQTPSAVGSIYIAVSAEPQVAFSSQVVTATISGTVSSQSANDYPIGATAWAEQIFAVSFGPSITLFSVSQPIGKVLYLSRLRIQGLESQKVTWQVFTGGVFNVFSNPPAGVGDVDDVYVPPIYLATWSSSGFGALLMGTGDTLLGTVNVYGYVAGYYK